MAEALQIDTDMLAHPRRPVCKACLDWSERRHHLAGTLGAAVMTRFTELNWAARDATPEEKPELWKIMLAEWPAYVVKLDPLGGLEEVDEFQPAAERTMDGEAATHASMMISREANQSNVSPRSSMV